MQPPRGHVVGQGDIDRGLAVLVGDELGFPVGRVLKVLAHVVFIFNAERRRGLVAAATAAEAAAGQRFFDGQPFAGDEQAGAEGAAQRLAEVERLQDVGRVVLLQQQHSQIDQGQRYFGLHAVAGGVGHGDVERGRVAGGVLGRAGRQRHGQVELVGRHDDLHVADADVGVGEVSVGRIHRFDGRDRHVDVGRVVGGDGQRDDLATLDGDDLLVDDVAPLDHQPGLHRLGEGGLDEDLGRLARLILTLVERQIHRPHVGVAAPAGELGVHRPQRRAAELLAPAAVGDGGDDQVRAALFGREADRGLAVLVGGDRLAADLGIDRRPAGDARAELLDALALPVAAVEGDFHRLPGQRFAVPIDGQQIDLGLVAGVN